MSQLHLHPMTQDDVPMVLPWRNHPSVRRVMYTRQLIAENEHLAYFERALQDPAKAYFIAMDPASGALGLVSFVAIDQLNGLADLGFYLRPDAPRGSGSRLMPEVLDLAFGSLRLAKLCSEVLVVNQASIGLHQKFGFRIEGLFRQHHVYDGERIDVLRLAAFPDDWAKTHTDQDGRTAASRHALTTTVVVGDALRSEPNWASLVARCLHDTFRAEVAALHLESYEADRGQGMLMANAHDIHLRGVRRLDRELTVTLLVRGKDGTTIVGGHADLLLPEESA